MYFPYKQQLTWQMLTPKAETKLSSSRRPTAMTLTPGQRHRELLSLLRHRKEEKKAVHMAKLP